jgi:deoxycytidylate deaminase
MGNGIAYPYLPEGKEIKYVPCDDKYMVCARMFAKRYSLDKTMPGAAVIVKNDVVIGMGANGSDYHKTHQCQRVLLGCKSGEGYELCEGCHPKNHSEVKAIEDTKRQGFETTGADLYLWGHWWCCKPCWDKMIEAGIKNVYLLEGSEKLFNKEHLENIVGRQFE